MGPRGPTFFIMNFKSIFPVLLGIAIAVMVIGFAKFGPKAERSKPGSEQTKSAQPNSAATPELGSSQSDDEMSAEDEAEALGEQMSILPQSLKDVPRPVSLDVDDNGNLIINGKIRIMFDYYLSALGEEDIDLIRERVRYELTDLPMSAQEQALSIFDNYLAYLGAIDELSASHSGAPLNAADTADIIRVKEGVQALRRQYFTPEVAVVFFAKDDAWDNYIIQRLKISTDTLLSDEEKNQAIDALDALLPPEILAHKQQSDVINDYRETSGRTTDALALEQMRRETFGIEAESRLESLDLKRAEWNDRVSAYQDDRNRALEFAEPGSAAYAATLEQVRNQHFQGAELSRIAALDEIERVTTDPSE